MESSKASALLLICMLFLSSAAPILGCGICGKPPTHKPQPKPKGKPKSPKGPITVPPITVPPITVPPVLPKPPVTVPPITIPPVLPTPPVTVPPITVPPVLPKPPVAVPPVTVPPITVPPLLPKPPITVPPVTVPPITVPPVTVPPVLPKRPAGKPCGPQPATCPIDTLKLGACVDLLGGLVHIGVGDPAVNECCPVLKGLAELEAAVCLCTTLKLKLLNLKIFVPLALQLLVTCGKTPPPGFTCSL